MLSKFTGQKVVIMLETIFSSVQGAQLVVLSFARSKTHAFLLCFGSSFFPSFDPVVVVCSNKARRQFKFVCRKTSSSS